MTDSTKNSHTEKAHNQTKAKPTQEENKKSGLRRFISMSNFIVISFLTVGTILVGIAINYHTKGGYESIKLASVWGIIGYALLGVGFYFAYYEYVVKPARAADRADKEQTERGAAPTISLSPQEVNAADRPWLSVDVVPNGPLTFKDDQVSLAVKFNIRNTGRSAATGADIIALLIAPKLGRDIYKEAINRQKEACAKTADLMPRTVFPGDGYSTDWKFVIGRQEVEKNGIENIVGLLIVGCVNYRFGDQTTTYQTGFMRDVRVFKPEMPGARYGLFLDQDVPADRLVFDVSSSGGDYAR